MRGIVLTSFIGSQQQKRAIGCPLFCSAAIMPHKTKTKVAQKFNYGCFPNA
jgi:hypothetical protein